MRVILESIRFVSIFFVLGTVLSVFSFMILYPIIGENAENSYGWTSMICTLVIMFFLYRNKGWGKGLFNKTILWFSLLFVVLLAMLTPGLNPEHLHTTKYAYSYGIPFNFLTLYIENSPKFLISNLISGRITGWSVSVGGILANFILFYFIFRLILLKLPNKAVNDLSSKPIS